jgi:hypothetical protein
VLPATDELSELRNELAALRETVDRIEQVPQRSVRRRTIDQRKIRIACLKAQNPKITGYAIATALDASNNEKLRPFESWTDATGLRLWRELWTCKELRVRRCVRKYVYTVPPAFQSAKPKVIRPDTGTRHANADE